MTPDSTSSSSAMAFCGFASARLTVAWSAPASLHQQNDEEADEEDIGDRRQPLLPEVVGSLLGGAEAANLGEGRAQAHVTGLL